jgi:hypothetical protein
LAVAFAPLKLKSESGANTIANADDAYSFVAHLSWGILIQPHWEPAQKALKHAGVSDSDELLAWQTFRAAAKAEGWLLEPDPVN